jgi:hypothetical protein
MDGSTTGEFFLVSLSSYLRIEVAIEQRKEVCSVCSVIKLLARPIIWSPRGLFSYFAARIIFLPRGLLNYHDNISPDRILDRD